LINDIEIKWTRKCGWQMELLTFGDYVLFLWFMRYSFI
jgi:hypothetical protein